MWGAFQCQHAHFLVLCVKRTSWHACLCAFTHSKNRSRGISLSGHNSEYWGLKGKCLFCRLAFVSLTPFLLGMCTCGLLTLELSHFWNPEPQGILHSVSLRLSPKKIEDISFYNLKSRVSPKKIDESGTCNFRPQT